MRSDGLVVAAGALASCLGKLKASKIGRQGSAQPLQPPPPCFTRAPHAISIGRMKDSNHRGPLGPELSVDLQELLQRVKNEKERLVSTWSKIRHNSNKPDVGSGTILSVSTLRSTNHIVSTCSADGTVPPVRTLGKDRHPRSIVHIWFQSRYTESLETLSEGTCS